MTAYSGSVAYLKYVSKSEKGDIKPGHEFNSVFGLGESSEARTNFTSQVIVETFDTALTLTPIAGTFGEDKDIKVVHEGVTSYCKIADVATAAAKGDKVAYKSSEFQMESVPATDIPTIGPKMEHIALVAEPRRIAVKYDQITAFQA